MLLETLLTVVPVALWPLYCIGATARYLWLGVEWGWAATGHWAAERFGPKVDATRGGPSHE